jgi:hypothetical protein
MIPQCILWLCWKAARCRALSVRGKCQVSASDAAAALESSLVKGSLSGSGKNQDIATGAVLGSSLVQSALSESGKSQDAAADTTPAPGSSSARGALSGKNQDTTTDAVAALESTSVQDASDAGSMFNAY